MPEAVKWGPGRESAFIDMLDYELLQARTARTGLERQWTQWLEQYRVPGKSQLRKFPYEGAAGYTLPLTAIDVDVLYSKFMQTVHAADNIWTTEALNDKWVSAAKPLQDFLTVLDQRLLRMFNVNKRVFLEATKLGTGIYKTGWRYERRQVVGYDAYGKRQRQTHIISAPFVDHVRLPDFVMPAYAYAIQPDDQGGAPWVCERLRVGVDALRSMAAATQSPFMPNLDKATVDFIIQFEESDKPPHDVKIQELDFTNRAVAGQTSATRLTGDDFDSDKERGLPGGQSIQRKREIEIWEAHARFPTTSPGASQDDVVVWYHVPSRRIVRAVYAYYDHGARPYDAIRYFPGDGFYGIGLCEQKEMFQGLGSDLMNFTIDNVLLANSRMIVARGGANISPGEAVYPYKVWVTDGDVRSDFGVFPMSDIYPSLGALQSGIHQLGERRTGIGDIQIGNMQNLPGRTPATTMMSLLQEGNRRPDLTIRDMRHEGLSVVGLRMLQLCQQFISSPVDYDGQRWLDMMVSMLGVHQGGAIAAKLRTPMEPVEYGVGVSLAATSGAANKEVAKQGTLALLQLAAQITPQFLQLIQVAMQAQGTPLAEVALKSAQGLQQLYTRVLESYDVRNVDEILPLADHLAQQAPGGPNGAAPGNLPPGVGGAQGADIDPRMAQLLAGFGAGGGNPGQ